jgi:hypothetical protein
MAYSTDAVLKISKKGRVNPTQQVSWWIRSNEDPRWNYEGFSPAALNAVRDVAVALESMKKDMGDPPADLDWGYVK